MIVEGTTLPEAVCYKEAKEGSTQQESRTTKDVEDELKGPGKVTGKFSYSIPLNALPVGEIEVEATFLPSNIAKYNIPHAVKMKISVQPKVSVFVLLFSSTCFSTFMDFLQFPFDFFHL